MSKYSYTMVIDGYIPRSPNATARQHFGRRMDERRFWESVIGCNAYRLGIAPATGRREVVIRVKKPGSVRLRDKDNLYASVKHCLDALTSLQIIVDDNPQYCTLSVIEENGCKGYGTVIMVKDD